MKLKLLVLTHTSELLGGAERSLLDVLDVWAKKENLEVEFIVREPLKSLIPEITKRGWKYYTTSFTFWSDSRPPTDEIDIFHKSLFNAQTVIKIEEIIKKSKPDLVVTNSIVAPWAALAAYFQKVNHVWFVREYGGLDHGRTFEIGEEETWRDVGNLSALVIANSKTLAEFASKYIEKSKITTLYNPFNIEEIISSGGLKIDNPYKHQDSLKLMLVGSFAQSKGQQDTIKAVGKLNAAGHKTELCLIGTGDSDVEETLKKQVRESNVTDKVHFVGYQLNPEPFIAYADIGIMASRMEAFGRTTFEYIALGKPVVGTNTGGTTEMVIDGTNGYLFSPGDWSSLADKIMKYSEDPGLILRHGKASKLQANKMMNGEFNATAVYEKVKKTASSPYQPPVERINYMHRWIEYLELAQRAIDKSGELSLRRIVKRKARARAKSAYMYLSRRKVEK